LCNTKKGYILVSTNTEKLNKMKNLNIIIANRSAHQPITFFDKIFTIGGMIIPQFTDSKNATKFHTKADAQAILDKLPQAIKDDCIIL